jgi:hypothetical protein
MGVSRAGAFGSSGVAARVASSHADWSIRRDVVIPCSDRLNHRFAEVAMTSLVLSNLWAWGIRRSRTRSAALIGVLVAGAACRDVPPPTPTEPDARSALSSAAVSQDPAPDPMDVAKAVPGFGGYFLDNGVPTVYLADPSRRPDAENALAGFLADRGFTASALRVRQGTYDWQQLDAWHEKAWPRVLSVSGAVYTDIDERSNRLRFGGVDAAAVQNIASALAGLGIPSGAVVVQRTAPIERVVTLRDRVRPVDGGYQINFFPTPASPLTLVCTLGFNVVKNGVNSFITNSHCTNHQGGTTPGTDYYQPTRGGLVVNPNNFIGIEVEDPEYEVVNCTQDFQLAAQCRYSDASRAAYAAGVPFQLGRIARTTTRYQDTPTQPDPVTGDPVRVPVLEVDPVNPFFRITKEQKRSIIGDEANKVGRTTGWTFGPVIETCINTLVLGTVPPIIQRCQDRVRADVAGGDSGSPVFGRITPRGDVRLFGILWGGSVADEEVTFVFSPMAGIHRELGDFKTHQ